MFYFPPCVLNTIVVAFAVASNQNKELLGKNGLLPSDLYLRRIDEHFADAGWRKGLHVPTLLLFTDRSKIDEHLDSLAYVGLALSGILMVFGSANMLIMALLWLLYHSIVNVGQRWLVCVLCALYYKLIINHKKWQIFHLCLAQRYAYCSFSLHFSFCDSNFILLILIHILISNFYFFYVHVGIPLVS